MNKFTAVLGISTMLVVGSPAFALAIPTPPPSPAAKPLPVPAATSIPPENPRQTNRRRVACASAAPEAIGQYELIVVEKKNSNDFDTIFERLQEDVNATTKFLNTAVTAQDIVIDLHGPVPSDLIPHFPRYFTSANGSIRYLRASGCGHEFVGFSPIIYGVRVGVTTALQGNEPYASSKVHDVVSQAIRTALSAYCGAGRFTLDLEKTVVVCL